MATHELDVAAFRATFPAFSDAGTYPDPVVQIYWDMGTSFIDANDTWAIAGTRLQSALNFMAAHLLQSFALISAGQTTVTVVKGSRVDKVQVDLEPPPSKDMWGFWLSTTPYGLLLLALMTAASAGGFYVPGRPERSAFRKVGGRF